MDVICSLCIHHHSDDISSRANHYSLHPNLRLSERGLAPLAIPIKKGEQYLVKGEYILRRSRILRLFFIAFIVYLFFFVHLHCFTLKLSVLQFKTQFTLVLCVSQFLQSFLDAFSFLLLLTLVSLMHHVLVGHAINFCTALNCLCVWMIIYQLNVHCGHFLITVHV